MMSQQESNSMLWMGDLEPYMDEPYIKTAFAAVGENVISVKLIKNRDSGSQAGYGFIEFVSPECAYKALVRLNGKKLVPGSCPLKYFKLNYANHGKPQNMNISEFSVFVGDLTDDVDDYTLFSAFSKRYRSCRAGKVVCEPGGKSKGYGFVRFSDEGDQQRAVIEMQHTTGVGRKPIRVSLALSRNRVPIDVPGTPNYRDPNYTHYTQHHPPYTSYYGGWPGYNPDTYCQYSYGQQDYNMYNNQAQNYYNNGTEEDEELEDPCLEIDVDKMNKEFMEQSEEFYEALESSRWHPLDSATSEIKAPPT